MKQRTRTPQWQWVYDGRDLLAAIELHADGRWHVLMHGRDDVGAFPTREMGVAFANARRNRIPAAAVVGERIADAKRVNAIRSHQRQAETRQARRKKPRSGRLVDQTPRQSGISGQPHGGRQRQ